jgi:hypothetical protein
MKRWKTEDDTDRLLHILEGLAGLDEDPDPTDDDLRAEALAAGFDLDAWAGELEARARASPRGGVDKGDGLRAS